MKKRIRSLPAIIIFAGVFGFLSRCTPEEASSEPANVEATFELKSTSAMDGKITINEAFLKLDRLQATGNLRGENVTDLTHPISPEEPPYKLSTADSSQISFVLTSKAYDQLDFHLFLFQDMYELVINTKEDTAPPPVDQNDGEKDEDNSGGDSDGSDDDNGGSGDDGGDNDDGSDHNGGDDDGDGDDQSGDDDDGDDDEDEDDDEDDDKDKGKNEDKEDDKDKDKNKDKDDDDDDDEEDDDDGRASSSQEVRTVDLDHFFQNAKPAIVVFGIYENNGVTISIIFAGSGIEKFSMRAKQNDSFNIGLDERNSAEITFDPERWFESLTPGDIESAAIQTYQQQKVLFIHRDFNSALFEALVSKMEASADVTIRKGDAVSF